MLRWSLIGLLLLAGLLATLAATVPHWAPGLVVAVAARYGVTLDAVVIERAAPAALSVRSVEGRYDGHGFAITDLQLTPPWRRPTVHVGDLTVHLGETPTAAPEDAAPQPSSATALAQLRSSRLLPALPVTLLRIDALAVDGLPAPAGALRGRLRVDPDEARLRVDSSAGPDGRTLHLTLRADARDTVDLFLSRQAVSAVSAVSASTAVSAVPAVSAASSASTVPPDATAPDRARDFATPVGERPADELLRLSTALRDTTLEVEADIAPDLLPSLLSAFDVTARLPEALAAGVRDAEVRGHVALALRAPRIAQLAGQDPAAVDETVLRVAPASALEARGSLAGRALRMTITPETDFELRLGNAGSLASDGALRAELSATGPSPEQAELALRASAVGGQRDAPTLELALDARVDHGLGRGELGARTRLFLDTRDGEPSVTVDDATLTIPTLRHRDSGLELRGVRISAAEPVRIDTARPATTRLVLTARVDELAGGPELLTLDLEAALTVEDGVADLTLRAPGFALAADARYEPGDLASAEIELGALRLAFDEPTTLPRRGLRWVGLPAGSAVRDGVVSGQGRPWPLDDTAHLAVSVEGLDGSAAGASLNGLSADLSARFVGEALRVAAQDVTATRLRRDELTVRDLTARVDLTLPGLRDRLAAALGESSGDALDEAREEALDEPLEAALEQPRETADSALPDLRAELHALRLDEIVWDDYRVRQAALTGTAEATGAGLGAKLAVSATGADAGVPLANLDCRVELTPSAASIAACGFDALGGHVVAPAGTVRLPELSGYVPVAIQGVDLGATLALMQDEGLGGDGVLDGALPLRLVEGTPVVRDGYVGARPPGGHIAYAADAALLARMQQPGVALALTALGDFRYDTLGSYIDYEPDGTLALRATLAGRSPAVENGRAINFNLDVTQNLPLLLKSLRLSQTIEESIERRLRERRSPP